MKKTAKNHEKRQKLKFFENTRMSLLFQENSSFSRTLIWRNEPNFNASNIIATSYNTVGYNDFFQNSTKKTNPIKANFFTTLKPHFSAELFSDTRLRQEPPAGCKNGDWLVPAEGRVVPVPFFATAVQRSSRQKKPLKLVPACIKQGSPRGENRTMPSLFPGKPAFLRQLFLGSKPNFKNFRPILTHETKGTYNNSHPQNPKKKQTQSKPNQTQFKNPQKNNTPKEIPHKNKPNTNPNRRSAEGGQTQSKPNTNPISWRNPFTSQPPLTTIIT